MHRTLRDKTKSFKKRVADSNVSIAPKYNSANTIELLFRLNASVWPNVFPWCIANTAIAFAIHYSDAHFLNLSTSDKAHVFMSLMVSFLVVTRSRICLGRYMAARTGLSEMMRTSKELIHHAVAFTRYKNPDKAGRKWRVSMASRTISILRVVVAILKFPSSRKFVCELTDITDDDRDALKLAVGRSNERSPHVLTLFLRSLIASHQHKISPPLETPQEMVLHQYTSDFLTAYSSIMSNVATPYPFPLVQMTRTFLFLYVFSLPFALSDDIEKLTPYLIVVFFMTYGFIGLELISIEMDDPFGDDPNDFNIEAAAKNAYKDILVCIEDIDGAEAREKVEENFDFSIRDRIRKTIQNHQNYTRISEWGGRESDSKIDEIAEKFQATVRRRRNSDISEISGLLMSINKKRGSFGSNDSGQFDFAQSPLAFELNAFDQIPEEGDLSAEDDDLSPDLSYADGDVDIGDGQSNKESLTRSLEPPTLSYSNGSDVVQRSDSIRSEQRNFMEAVQRFDAGRSDQRDFMAELARARTSSLGVDAVDTQNGDEENNYNHGQPGEHNIIKK